MSDARQIDIAQPSAMPTTAGGSAVGVPNRKWYIAVVKNNTELLCQKRLSEQGYEAYVPTQEDVVLGSKGRKKIVTSVLIPAKVIVRVTENERKEVVKLPYIIRYMTDRVKRPDKYGRHPIATIPDEQIEKLKFVLFNTTMPVSIESSSVCEGEEMKVMRGSLMGLKGFVKDISKNQVSLQVKFGSLGVVSISVNIADLERV